ncbi:MAG: hypothetical protein ABW170_10480 [Candidatus Thiodiazotropha sp. L084R]
MTDAISGSINSRHSDYTHSSGKASGATQDTIASEPVGESLTTQEKVTCNPHGALKLEMRDMFLELNELSVKVGEQLDCL